METAYGLTRIQQRRCRWLEARRGTTSCGGTSALLTDSGAYLQAMTNTTERRDPKSSKK